MITVLYVCHAPNTLGGAALSLYNLIRSVSKEVNPIVLLSERGIVSNFFENKGIRCIFFPFLGGIKSKSTLRTIVRMMYEHSIYKLRLLCFAKNISRLKIDIIHSNSSIITVGYELAKILGIKHIWHIREFIDLDFGFKPMYGWDRLKSKIYKSDAVIAITQAVYRHFELDANPCSYVLWDAVRSKEDKILTPTKDKFFFHSAANLSEGKGTDKVVEAFLMSKLYKTGYKLYLAGNISDTFKAKLQHMAEKDSAENSILFLGYINDTKMYLERATAFLMMSRNEGLGRVTIESMFYGCPVIGYNSAGTVELLNENRGFLVNSIEECAATMKNVSERIPLELISNAQTFAVEHFSEESYGEKISMIYNKIL